MRRSFLIIPCAAALIAGVGIAAQARATNASPAAVTHLRLVAVDVGPGTSSSNIDIPPVGAPNVGDAFTETNVLRDGDSKAGALQLTCVILAVDPVEGPTYQDCHAVFDLGARGQIMVAGPINGPEASLAVVGGTGSYRTVDGEASLRLIDEHMTEWDVALTR